MKTHPFALPSPAVRRLRRAEAAREKALKDALEDQKRCPHNGITLAADLLRRTNGFGSTMTHTRARMTCARCGLREIAWSRDVSRNFQHSVALPMEEADQIGPTFDPHQ
jgi:hypothetical protein